MQCFPSFIGCANILGINLENVQILISVFASLVPLYRQVNLVCISQFISWQFLSYEVEKMLFVKLSTLTHLCMHYFLSLFLSVACNCFWVGGSCALALGIFFLLLEWWWTIGNCSDNRDVFNKFKQQSRQIFFLISNFCFASELIISAQMLAQLTIIMERKFQKKTPTFIKKVGFKSSPTETSEDQYCLAP